MKEFKNTEKENQKRQNTIRFINAARKLIDENGLESVSIRKIAEMAGFHNSTIYLYFDDLDQLLMLASITYFREYSRALGEQSRKNLSSPENFLSIWNIFADSIFKAPEIYYNFFFGKHSENLQDIMNTYYNIFPNEREEFSEDIENMYYGRNIQERCMNILRPMIEEDSAVTEENISMINDMIVAFCKYKLEQKCLNPALDSDILKKQIIEAISYITGIRA